MVNLNYERRPVVLPRRHIHPAAAVAAFWPLVLLGLYMVLLVAQLISPRLESVLNTVRVKTAVALIFTFVGPMGGIGSGIFALFSIRTQATRWRGKNLAIAGIIVSSATLLACACLNASIPQFKSL